MAFEVVQVAALLNGAFFVEVRVDTDETTGGDIDWFRFVNNHPTRTVFGELIRTNGQAWRSGTFAPGADVTYNAGGPIQDVDDLPEWRVWTD